MRYYRAHIVCGSKFKKKQYERTIFVRTSDDEAMSGVLTVIRKIPFGRLISARLIDRTDYLTGVSGHR